MENFNANDARKIVFSLKKDELHNILVDIKNAATCGDTVLHIYKPMNSTTVEELAKRGFKITKHPSIAIQKDDLYYSIYWA